MQSVSVLSRLLEFYDMTYEQFIEVRLPVERYVTYTPRFMENLKDAIVKYGRPDVSAFWGENRERYHRLKAALEPVLDERAEQVELPEFPFDIQMVGRPILSLKFDAYSEWLIDQCMAEQNKLIDAICG